MSAFELTLVGEARSTLRGRWMACNITIDTIFLLDIFLQFVLMVRLILPADPSHRRYQQH